MGISSASVLAILSMALATYAARAGGLWLMGRMRPSRRMEAGLRYLPGAVLAAIVVPAALREGPPGVAALVATVLVGRRTGNPLIAAAVGVGVIWALRNLG